MVFLWQTSFHRSTPNLWCTFAFVIVVVVVLRSLISLLHTTFGLFVYAEFAGKPMGRYSFSQIYRLHMRQGHTTTRAAASPVWLQ